MSKEKAGLGFKVHTGWTALVAIAGAPGHIRILVRRRLELLPDDDTMPRFVYHKAAELPVSEAADLVERVTRACEATARTAIEQILKELSSLGVSTRGAGIPTGSTVLPGTLAAILGSHALIHAAEGQLFQHAILSACENQGLRVTCTRERDLWSKLAGGVRQKLDDMRKSVGSPWAADQKTATAAALVALQNG